ncbi:MAG: hypothetical protein PHX21_00745 [bacterium]|nr:hypothetical protein [bacterium]
MAKISIKKCPDCGGDLVKSNSPTNGYTTYFWAKPWSKFIGVNNEPIFPWLCMKCSRVFFYMDDKQFNTIKQEYEHEKLTSH